MQWPDYRAKAFVNRAPGILSTKATERTNAELGPPGHFSRHDEPVSKIDFLGGRSEGAHFSTG